jgi:hypothetical protein
MPDRIALSRTKDRLAAELRKVAAQCKPDRAAKYEALAVRAATGEFDDYADVHVCGPTALYLELRQIGAFKFADRVASGEFDASFEESEEWARSQTDPQVVALMQAMGIGPDRSKDQ